MIVEFTGCTGAGKTTLLSEVQSRLSETLDVTTSFDLIASPFGLGRVTNRSFRHVILELAVLPVFLRSWRKNKAVISYALRILVKQKNHPFFALNNLRAVVRKIGVYEKIRLMNPEQIVMVDEGSVHLAHKLFVFNTSTYSPEVLEKFAALIPLPDVVVYVRVPTETLIRRTLERSDPPREIRKNRAQAEEYIRKAVDMFETISMALNVKGRLLTVDLPGSGQKALDAAADQVAKSIINIYTAGSPANALTPSESWKNWQKLDNLLKN